MHSNPSIIEFECTRENRELYKNFVLTVLNDGKDVSPQEDDEDVEKYMGNKNFTGMSKKVGREWERVDSLTRSVFDELAKEGENENSVLKSVYIIFYYILTIIYFFCHVRE